MRPCGHLLDSNPLLPISNLLDGRGVGVESVVVGCMFAGDQETQVEVR